MWRGKVTVINHRLKKHKKILAAEKSSTFKNVIFFLDAVIKGLSAKQKINNKKRINEKRCINCTKNYIKNMQNFNKKNLAFTLKKSLEFQILFHFQIFVLKLNIL